MDKRGETARERKVLEGEREGATGRGWGGQRSEQGRRVRWLWTALPFTCPGDPHGYINRSPRSERYLLSMSPSSSTRREDRLSGVGVVQMCLDNGRGTGGDDLETLPPLSISMLDLLY